MMAAWQTRLLIVPLLTLHISWLLPHDPPPICLIPFGDAHDIHCHWTGSRNSLIPTNFTLHWNEAGEFGHSGNIDVGKSDSGIIPRANYSAYGSTNIHIWVSAANAHGKTDSETLVTNTRSIFQPATPSITNHSHKPLEIFWNVLNTGGDAELWQCKVQYKRQCDPYWTKVEGTYEVSCILENAVPFTTYKFRVCCKHASDERAVMSNWSAEYTAETPAAAPLGMLDVWSDCDSTSYESKCTLLWKDMPMQQARGNIDSYVVTMKLKNGSVLNISGLVYMSAETCAQYRLDMIRKEPSNLASLAQLSYPRCQEQDQSCFHYYHLSVPVVMVKDIGLTATATGGKSSPALVALLSTCLLQSPVKLKVRGKSEELNVAWTVHSPFSDRVQEYVVQYKPTGLPHTPCLNWIKVKNQTDVTLRGPLSNYTAYNVSLFAIVNNSSCLLGSTIAYTVEGVPPEVTDFQAILTSQFSVNLTWTPIPLNQSQGHIVQYVVGFCNGVNVYNVSSSQSSYQLYNLNPDQQYEVWISAKTTAGEGKRTTVSFTTTSPDNLTQIVLGMIVVAFVIPLFIIILVVLCCSRTKISERLSKIPDPTNSTSFKQMSNPGRVNFWQSLPPPSNPMENSLIISQVEVVPEPEVNQEPEVEQPEELREDGQSRGKELQGYGGLERNNSILRQQKEYSQMIDSSDEEANEDEEWNEQSFPSDYEKHFLPCTVDQ
ncbi:interleukin 12 receptor, beta 2a, like isoform X2 [Neoarius graeffei]|uniref:interleukin 12 receptor, beta 2a, like isoform X2 n=1 Tax=Neoarius graeffei TaxID=443677 RepID=UPI00298C7236|nr:interleukin 12 receptor, beta 2a, like isoform X2 [Neoarius graeffei]